MTLKELKNYQSNKRQVEIWEEEFNASYIKGCRYSNTPVQSGKVENPTADIAELEAEKADVFYKEFERRKGEMLAVVKYIAHINDTETKEIAARYAFKGQTFEKIGEAMHMDRTTASKKLSKYISHNSH